MLLALSLTAHGCVSNATTLRFDLQWGRTMNEGYALRHLRRVMNWSFERDNQETTWLRMMSDFKYDSYRDFWAGSRFAEALLDWLHQFEPEDRQKAYDFVRNKLIFLNFTEIQHLVNRTFSVYARNFIVDRVAAKTGVPKYLVWSRENSRKLFQNTVQRTLFIGLSDGARIDGFRRANVGTIANDQVALGYEISDEKWDDIHANLKERTGDPNATFDVLFLIDDFTGSSKTLLREESGKWKGKLTKFAKAAVEQKDKFSSDCAVVVHHYIGTEMAKSTITKSLEQIKNNGGPEHWFSSEVRLSFDLLLSGQICITKGIDLEFDALVDKYYDPSIETKSIKIGKTDAKFGFASCGLPLILEHNTPNNSISLLWAESTSSNDHCMRPLFRRRQRHS
jgi:hypothetical protein